MKFFKSVKKCIDQIVFLFSYSWKVAKKGYVLVLLKTIISSVQPFAYLLFPKYILDELSTQKRWDITLIYVIAYIAVLAFFTLANSLFNYFSDIIVSKIQNKNDLLYDSFYLQMDYGRLENGPFRDWGNWIQNNLNAWNFINDTVSGFIINFVQLIGYTYIIASLHPVVIIFIICIIFLQSLVNKKSEKNNYEYQPIVVQFQRRFNYLFNTMISFDYGKDIRINNASKWLIKKYDCETNDFLLKFTSKQKKDLSNNTLRSLIDFVQTIIVYGYCAYKVISSSITVGSFTVFLGAITAFSGCFTGFIGKCIGLKYVLKFADEYIKFEKESLPSNCENQTIDISEITKEGYEIRFENVSFKYPNTENYVLKNINLKIQSKERLSVVGYNGAGKSTFIKLICRLYEPSEGKIFLNDVDVSTIKMDQYRELLSVVFQDFKIFSMSMAENVVLNRTYDDKKLFESIEKSGLSDKLNVLEKGVNTQIGREFDYDGLEFSGGEAQKLECARAYYKDSPIVILDEPTASLDPIAESRLYERFNSIIGEKSAIYISHRLASVKFCDKVAVFSNGELCEYGTHHELIQLNGLYSEMFRKQAEYYIDNEEDLANGKER